MSQKLARALTEVFSPAVLITLFLIVLGVHTGAFWAGLLAAVFAGIIPIAGIVLATRKGELTDHHVGDRKQRKLVVAASLVSMVIGYVLLVVFSAPKLVQGGMLAIISGGVSVGIINLWWKISVHLAVATSAFLGLTLTVSPWWGVSLLSLPCLAWSRVYLRDHTLAQTIAGTALGAAIAVIFSLLSA